MELPSGQQSQPIGTASAASAEQVNSNCGCLKLLKMELVKNMFQIRTDQGCCLTGAR